MRKQIIKRKRHSYRARRTLPLFLLATICGLILRPAIAREDHLQKATEEYPEKVSVQDLLDRAESFKEEGKLRPAIKIYRSLLRGKTGLLEEEVKVLTKSRLSECYLLEGKRLTSAGKKGKAIAYYNHAIKECSRTIELQQIEEKKAVLEKEKKELKRKADRYFYGGKDQEEELKSMPYCAQLIKEYGTAEDADYFHYHYLRCLLSKGMYRECIEGFHSFIATYPKSKWAGNAYMYAGEAYGLLGEPELRIKEFEKLVRFYPQSTFAQTARFVIASYHALHGDRSKAFNLYRDIAERSPETKLGKDAAAFAGEIGNIEADEWLK